MAAPNDPTPSTVSHVHSLDGLQLLEEFIRDHGTTLVSIFHPLAPRWRRFSPIFQGVCTTCLTKTFNGVQRTNITRKIAKTLPTTGSKVKCVQINSVGNFDLVDKFVERTPFLTMVLCRASGEFKTYHGALREEE